MARDLDERMRVVGPRRTVGDSLEGSGGKTGRTERLTPPEEDLSPDELLAGIEEEDLSDQPTGFARKMPLNPPISPNREDVGGVPLREVSDEMLSEKAKKARKEFRERQSGVYRQELIQCVREVVIENQENLEESWRQDEEFRSTIASLVVSKYDFPLDDVEEVLADLRIKF